MSYPFINNRLLVFLLLLTGALPARSATTLSFANGSSLTFDSIERDGGKLKCKSSVGTMEFAADTLAPAECAKYFPETQPAPKPAVEVANTPATASPSPDPTARPLTPATMSWGGYRGNEQLVGSGDTWPFVQKYMDAFLMHGAYWLHAKDDQYRLNLKALGEILQKNGKKADVETGFGELANYNPDIPKKRQSYSQAMRDIASFTEFAQNGVIVNKVRVDWFPSCAMAAYAAKFQITNSVQLFRMVTGADEFPATPPQGFDPAHGNWVEYNVLLQQAFPDIKVVFDQAPCNHRPLEATEMRKAVPWAGFGYGYDRELGTLDRKPALVNGQPVRISQDFGDLLMGVMLGSKKYGINFYGFEGDTPYNYISENIKGFPKEKLTAYLLAIEHFLHANGLHDARFLNDSGKAYKTTDHDLWDKTYHDRSMEYLEYWQSVGGRPDQYIAESWYGGPYELFPETKHGTFSNLARDVIRRLKGINDDGSLMKVSLSARGKGAAEFLPAGREIPVSLAPGQRLTVELQVRNDAKELNKGDARCTPLLRLDQKIPQGLEVSFATPEGKDITSEVTAHGGFDGYFVGGLEPGETKSLFMTVSRHSGRTAPTAPLHLQLKLYWNPQDPQGIARDKVDFLIP